jgi:hypothetical protein
VTNRLHAYLPLTALGVPVDFRPGRTGDIRFAGLTGLRPTTSGCTAIRAGIRDLVAGTFEQILAGCTTGRGLRPLAGCDPGAVAEAKARFAAPPVEPTTSVDVATASPASSRPPAGTDRTTACLVRA